MTAGWVDTWPTFRMTSWRSAPVYASDTSPWGDPSYGRSVYDYYDVPYYM